MGAGGGVQAEDDGTEPAARLNDALRRLSEAELAAEQAGLQAIRARGEAAAAYRREAAAEAALASLELELVRRDSEIAQLAVDRDAAVAAVPASLQEQAAGSRRAAELEALLAATRASTSWQLTRPLRAVTRLARRALPRQ